MKKCRSCGGTYQSVQDDGIRYFHVCPPGTPNPRDENVQPQGRPLLPTENMPIKREGKGADDVPDIPAVDLPLLTKVGP